MQSGDRSKSDWVGNDADESEERATSPARGGSKLMLKPVLIERNAGADLSRRAFIRGGTVGALGMVLGDMLSIRAAASSTSPPARAVILLWLWGGPSHLDTFDMKPGAPAEYRGPFEPIATAVPGVHVCELLPGLARRAGKFALLRADAPRVERPRRRRDDRADRQHRRAPSGWAARRTPRRSVPAPARSSAGCIKGAPGSLPPYIILGNPLHQGLKRAVGEGGGSLGSTHDPFRLDYEPGIGLKLPDVALPEGVDAARLGVALGPAASTRRPRAIET